MMNGWYGYGYSGEWMFFTPILWIIFWGIVLYFVIAWFREGSGNIQGRTPLDILKERYAKGEITKEEFEEIKKDLH